MHFQAFGTVPESVNDDPSVTDVFATKVALVFIVSATKFVLTDAGSGTPLLSRAGYTSSAAYRVRDAVGFDAGVTGRRAAFQRSHMYNGHCDMVLARRPGGGVRVGAARGTGSHVDDGGGHGWLDHAMQSLGVEIEDEL